MLQKPILWLGISAGTFLITVALIALFPPVFGIDFTGGSLIEFASPSSPVNVRTYLLEHEGLAVFVQATGQGSLLLRSELLSADRHQSIIDQLRASGMLTEELRFESIGPTIGAELQRKAWLGLASAMVAMIIYLAYTFRQMSGLITSWKFGIAATVALLHDVLVTVAAFSILRSFGATVDTLFITALLAIIGYSVNDTIVFFDRLRTEWLNSHERNLITVMDKAARATLIRSLNTSLTTIIVLLALLFFGGETIRWFVVALTVGAISGTYSTLFVAPAVLYLLTKKDL